MPRLKRSERLLAKAEAALIAAIEVYNKPNFLYREETFSILALNSWELLLKAKLVAERREDLRCLCVYDNRKTKDGRRSKRAYLRRNRTGNVQTIGLGRVITDLEQTDKITLGAAVKNNLDALMEIRDNAIHYLNASPELAKQVLEVGTASVTNFIELAKLWFGRDLSSYCLYLMPIGFISGYTLGTGVVLSSDERNLVHYLSELCLKTEAGESDNLHVSLGVDLSFRRSQRSDVPQFGLTNDPTAPKIQMTEENIRSAYPWDYSELIRRLEARYSDFKCNKHFHQIRKPLLQDPKYVHSRYLDPSNPKSSKKDFYSSAILNEFDKHYTRAKAHPS